jgi:hypothetical protein
LTAAFRRETNVALDVGRSAAPLTLVTVRG